MKRRLISLFTSLFIAISMVGVLPQITASAVYYLTYMKNYDETNIPKSQNELNYDHQISSLIPKKTGYTFLYWTDVNNKNEKYYPGDYYSYSGKTILLKANWELNTCKIIYDANGGYYAPEPQTVKYGQTVTLSKSQPVREGYEFRYWSDTPQYQTGVPSTVYSSGSSYKYLEDGLSVKLYARWAKSYTVNYYANGGQNAPSAQTKSYGVALKLRTGGPTRSGYTFLGWSENQYATTATYSPGQNYTDNRSLNLYAVWSKKSTTSYNNDYSYNDDYDYWLYNYDIPTVTGFKVAATSAQAVKLTCNKVVGATGYVFYRAVSGNWQRVGVSKTNSFYEGKLKSGTSYRYAVKAYKTVNGNNYYSASYPTLWTSTKPGTVNFVVATGSKKAVLKWSKVRGATGYIVYMKTSAKASWQKIAATKALSYTKTGLVTGRTYWFFVRAYKTFGGKNYWGAFVTKTAKIK